MRHERSRSHAELQNWLFSLGFSTSSQEKTGCVYRRQQDDTCLIIDTVICTLPDYQYVDYTSRQNELMTRHSRVFRFLLDNETSFESIKEDINVFLNEESDPENLRRFGGNRSEQNLTRRFLKQRLRIAFWKHSAIRPEWDCIVNFAISTCKGQPGMSIMLSLANRKSLPLN